MIMFLCVFRLLEKFEAYEKDPNYFDYIQPVPLVPATHLLPSNPSIPTLLSAFPTLLPWRVPVTPPTPIVPLPRVSAALNDQGVGYECLALSLLSGYPNEVDLVFNVLTVLTFKNPSALPSTEVGK